MRLNVQRGPKLVIVFLCLVLTACGCPERPSGASVTIVAPARLGVGGPEEVDDISGVAANVNPADARIVIYARAGDRWWIQPQEDAPFTPINSKLDWSNRIHLGFEYAALLVHKNYSPPKQPMQLPQVEGCVWAIDTKKARQ
jgi:hypothetical protein